MWIVCGYGYPLQFSLHYKLHELSLSLNYHSTTQLPVSCFFRQWRHKLTGQSASDSDRYCRVARRSCLSMSRATSTKLCPMMWSFQLFVANLCLLAGTSSLHLTYHDETIDLSHLDLPFDELEIQVPGLEWSADMGEEEEQEQEERWEITRPYAPPPKATLPKWDAGYWLPGMGHGRSLGPASHSHTRCRCGGFESGLRGWLTNWLSIF